MRMAISCLACGDFGRPTRRARLSSSSVDSGISEKSSWLSGIGLAFFATCPARADDADRFFAIFHRPDRVDLKKHASCDGPIEPLRSGLYGGMLCILPTERLGIGEYRSRFFERDTVLSNIPDRLGGVPREHIYVYTLIPPKAQSAVGDPDSKD